MKIKKSYIGKSVEIKGIAFEITENLSKKKLELLKEINYKGLYADNRKRDTSEGTETPNE